jgi:hypothetical protein
MAEKEIKVKVVTEADIEPLNDFSESLDDIQDKSEITVSVDDGDIEDAADKADDLTDGLDDVDDADPSIDVDDASVEDATDKATELGDKLDEINDKEVSVNVDNSSLERTNENLEETDNSLNNIKTTILGLVATAEIEHMATVADNVNNSWNRVQLTFEGTNLTMDVLKEKVSEVNAETSRGAGVIREYFNQMGIAGVTNADLLAESFESLSGKAYQTNSSIESMEAKMQTMVLTGSASTKMLKSLGLSAEDLANAIGVSVDELSDAFSQLSPEERLQAITTAMGDGAAANEMYGDSYEAMKQKAENAMSGLEGAVGQAILPSMIPALDAGTQAVKALTEGFKGLPEPVQGAIGTVMGVGAIATTGIGMFGDFAGAIANLGDAYGVLKGVYEALIPTEIAEGIAGWFSIGWIAAAILLGIALGLAFIYLYENCDWFREAVDNLAATLQALPGIIIGTLTDIYNQAKLYWDNFWNMVREGQDYLIDCINNFTSTLSGGVDYIISIVQGLFDYITSAGGLIPENVSLTGNQIIDAILGVMLFISTLPLQLAMIFVNIIAQALGFGQNFSQTMLTNAMNAVNGFVQWISTLPSRAYTYLSSFLSRVISWGGSIASQFLSAATKSVTNFANQIAQIPAKLGTELSNALNKVNEWAATLPAKFWEAGVNAVKNFLDALGIHSPGTMQTMMVWEVSEMARRVPIEGRKLVSNIGTLGGDIVDEFNPNLTANASLVSGGSTSSGGAGMVNNFYFSDIVVDNDERMEKIYDYITRQLYFDNTTAGRTV